MKKGLHLTVVTAVVVNGLSVVRAEAVAQTTAATARPARASWLTDRKFIPVGSIVTVVVDERTTARERASKIANADRSNALGLSAATPDFDLPITSANLKTSNNAESRNLGETARRGDLSSIFTVTVVGIEPNGNLRIAGTRTVEIDGNAQEWELSGQIRPDDVSAENLVPSSRIADAVIKYKGAKIGPSRGLISKILGIFWP
jgi:flagellar L-ring protein FlgH